MAAIVGAAAVGEDGANNTTVDTAAKNTTTGNLLAVLVCAQEGAGTNTITGVTDTAGNTYTAGTRYEDTGTGEMLQWFYARNITGNASNVAVATFSGNNRYKNIAQIEISGLDTSASVFDDESGATAGSSATVQPGNITLSASGIFLYGACSTNDRTWTPDGAFTEVWDCSTSFGFGSGTAAYYISGAATVNPTATASSSSNLACAAIAFLDAAAGGQPPRSMHQFRLRRAS